MKKWIMLVAVLMLLPACSGTNSGVEKAVEISPEIQDEFEKLPKEIKEQLDAPTKFPSEPSYVSLNYTREPYDDPNGIVINTDFMYGGGEKEWILHVITWYGDAQRANEKTYETVELDNGIKADIINDTEIEWKSENGNLHEVFIIDTQAKYTIDDLVEVANSMN